MEPVDEEIANPHPIGDVILDGDEDSQVAVFENGRPTSWALQFKKWRVYFNVPEPMPPTSVNDEVEPQPEPGGERALDDTTACKGKKRTSEDAGFELN